MEQQRRDEAPTPPAEPAPRPHFYVLLDRSGSMESMRTDVIGGFNALLAEQQADGDDARMTLIQFDSQEPHQVIVDAALLSEVPPLTEATFIPRGGTPLLDATGLMIAMAAIRQEHRKVTHSGPRS